MRIPNKFNGYSADGRRLYNMGGGGGPNTTYSQTSNIPEYARPYVEQMLGATQRQLFTGDIDPKTGVMKPTGFNDFTPYGATYKKDENGNPMRDTQGRLMYTNTSGDQARAAIAGPGIGQNIAANRLYNYAAPRQTQDASNIAADLSGRAVAAGQYTPMQAQSYLLNQPQQVRAAQVNAERIAADRIAADQIRADQVKAGRVGTGTFTDRGVADKYMSPYMQNVVQQQQREALRQGDMAASSRAAQSIGAGAFGGSRQAIVDAEANRNLATQLGDIQGQGLQQAFQNAQGQFNTEQGLGLQAQQANQQTGLQSQLANQQSRLAAQQANQNARLNAATQNQQAKLAAARDNQQTGLQSQVANQNAGMQAQQANQQANMQTAAQNQQALQRAQAESEASRQFGKSLGLQGLNQASQNAALLGSMGQQQYGQDMGVIQAQNQMGAQQQAQEQALINQKIQNYATEQQYPLMQLGVMSNMLRGLPMQSTNTNMYQQQPSAFNQAAGMIGTGLALGKDYKTFSNMKKGGAVKLAPGGIATGVPAGKLASELKGPQFSDDELQKKSTDPQTDQATKDLVSAEMARRSGLRSGAKGMAPGGIVAFKEGKEVNEDKKDEIEKIIDEALFDKFKAISPVHIVDPQRATDAEKAAMEEASQRLFAQQAINKMNKGITAAAENVSPIRKDAAPAAEVPAPVAAVPVAAPVAVDNSPVAGMMNAKQLATAQGKDPAGITAAKTDVGDVIGGVSPRAPMDLKSELDYLQEQHDAAGTLMKSTVPQEVEKKRAEKIALGLPSYYDTEKTNVTAKKAALKEQAKSDAEDRMIKFLINWGRTPGTELKGIVEAGYDLAHQQELSKKEQRKMENDLDGVLSRLNESEYLRQIGDMDAAEKSIKEAGEKYYKIGIEKAKLKADYNIKLMDQATKMEIAQLKAEVAAAKTGSMAPDLQVIDKLFHTLVGEGKPADAKTYHAAIAEYYQKYKPAGAIVASGPASISAGAGASNAQTAAEKAEDERQDKINKATRQLKRTTANRARLEGAEAEDDKKGITAADPKSAVLRVEREIRKEAEDQYGKKAREATPVAEPKKDEKKGGSNRAKADEILKGT